MCGRPSGPSRVTAGPYPVDVGDQLLGEHLVRGAGGHHPALPEDDELVAVHRGEVEVVQRDDGW